MNEQLTETASALRFPFAEAPAPGTLTDVAPRVKWLRMPLPYALDHINLWVLDDGPTWTLVDTGLSSSKTRELWEQLFDGPLKEKPVGRVIVTHFHPDHIGLAGWLVEKHNVPLWITAKEWAASEGNFALTPEVSAPMMTEQYTRAGMANALEAGLANRGNAYIARVSPLPKIFVEIDPAKPIMAAGTTWHVVIGEGHSPQLAALYAPELGVLISGDQVLPGISPNVSARFSEPDANPLGLFLGSFPRFSALPADTLVLPSHKMPFYGLQARVDQIVHHHHHRLELTKRACKDGASVAEVLKAMFPRQFDAHQLHFAIGETVAHLNYLLATGELKRESTASGIDRYTTV